MSSYSYEVENEDGHSICGIHVSSEPRPGEELRINNLVFTIKTLRYKCQVSSNFKFHANHWSHSSSKIIIVYTEPQIIKPKPQSNEQAKTIPADNVSAYDYDFYGH